MLATSFIFKRSNKKISVEQERTENAGNITLPTPFLIYNRLPSAMSCTQAESCAETVAVLLIFKDELSNPREG